MNRTGAGNNDLTESTSNGMSVVSMIEIVLCEPCINQSESFDLEPSFLIVKHDYRDSCFHCGKKIDFVVIVIYRPRVVERTDSSSL